MSAIPGYPSHGPSTSCMCGGSCGCRGAAFDQATSYYSIPGVPGYYEGPFGLGGIDGLGLTCAGGVGCTTIGEPDRPRIPGFGRLPEATPHPEKLCGRGGVPASGSGGPKDDKHQPLVVLLGC